MAKTYKDQFQYNSYEYKKPKRKTRKGRKNTRQHVRVVLKNWGS